MTAFTLSDPPPLTNRIVGGNTNRTYTEFARFLQAHPGEWGVFPREFTSKTRASNHAANIRRGHYPAFRGSYEATARDGQVYVRWMGANDE